MRHLILIAALLLPGCVSTVGKIVTAPVRVVGKGVDVMTTSQGEADRNRGRAIRKQEERERRDRERERDRAEDQYRY